MDQLMIMTIIRMGLGAAVVCVCFFLLGFQRGRTWSWIPAAPERVPPRLVVEVPAEPMEVLEPSLVAPETVPITVVVTERVEELVAANGALALDAKRKGRLATRYRGDARRARRAS